jgi:hypothetical protein
VGMRSPSRSATSFDHLQTGPLPTRRLPPPPPPHAPRVRGKLDSLPAPYLIAAEREAEEARARLRELHRRDVNEAARKGDALAHPEGTVPAEALGVVSGLAAGAATGAIAGPPGLIAGAVIGTALGIAAGALWREREEEHRQIDARLDKEIGVTGGSIGEASPFAPKAQIGAFSAAAMGERATGATARDSASPESGPMPSPLDD